MCLFLLAKTGRCGLGFGEEVLTDIGTGMVTGQTLTQTLAMT